MTTDPDGIEPGQTWTARYHSGNTVTVTTVTARRIGMTHPYTSTPNATSYLARRKFLAAYHRPAA
ncbi:hypothetical protein [Kitasatospora fiedleri]|uniref:hypothetical protein n=1 Tax=Kitasatospora fiedleri TaxID=2991545 RepID=UPI002499B0C2|nr:hypothetical protein [Kitasatospora fiedleri]